MPSSKHSTRGLVSDHALRCLHADLWTDAVPEDLLSTVRALDSRVYFRATRNRAGSRPSESEQLEELMRAAAAVATGEVRVRVAEGFAALLGRLDDVYASLFQEGLGSFEEELIAEGQPDGDEDAQQPLALHWPETHGRRWYRLNLKQSHHGSRARAAYIREYEQRPRFGPRQARTAIATAEKSA